MQYYLVTYMLGDFQYSRRVLVGQLESELTYLWSVGAYMVNVDPPETF